MGISLQLLIMILAVVSFMLAAAQVATPRVNFTALGLALWAFATIIRV